MLLYKMMDYPSYSGLFSSLCLLFIAGLLYSMSGYLKTVFLSFQLPGPPTVPFLGNCLLIKERDVLTKRASKAFDLYGSVCRLWVLLFPFFVVFEPEDLQTILASKKHTEKVFFYRLMHNFLGNGLITSSGDKWLSHRKLIQPSFHLNILEKFVGVFVDASDALLRKMEFDRSDINIAKYVNGCVMDILNESVLGVPVNKSENGLEDSPFRQGQLVVPYRVTHPWLLLDFFYRMTRTATDELNQKRRLNEFTRKMIQKRRQLTNDGFNTGRKCLLDYMLEISKNHPEFTEEDIVNEACTFMLAGQDSVGSAAAFCLFMLAQNQDVQEKCRAEIDVIFKDQNKKATIQDLRDMRYLEMCIKETLRLFPSVPIIARKIGEDVQVSKYTLPAGSNIFIVPYTTHRLPHVYKDPEKFNPERFTPTECESRHPYAFIPFSAGARNCIGNKFAILEIKTMVSSILRSYYLYPVPGKSDYSIVFRITLRASGGLWIRLKKRS